MSEEGNGDRKQRERRKDVTLRVHQEVAVNKAGLEFAVRDRSGALDGTLYVSVGGLTWQPARKHSGRTLSWEQFARLLEREA